MTPSYGTGADYHPINLFGRCTNADSGVPTDLWARANPVQDQAIWLAPTASRIHTIASADANDTSAGSGAQTLRIYGLETWDSDEFAFEDIVMNGVTGVPTVNSYVNIHRAEVLTSGASGPNVGIITATAATDSTVTFHMEAGVGFTQIATFAVPSTRTFVLSHLWGTTLNGGGTVNVAMRWLVNLDPENSPTIFIRKVTYGTRQAGSSAPSIPMTPPWLTPGPCMMKLQAVSDAADIEVVGGMSGWCVRNGYLN